MIDDGSKKLEKETRKDAAETANGLLQLIQNLSRELHPGQIRSESMTLDSDLDKDWGIDSLGRVELVSRIEQRFDVSLPETLFTAAEKPRDILSAIHKATGKRTMWSASNQKSTKPSLGEAKRVPDSAQTLIEVLEWHVSQHPQRPHIRLYSDTDEGEIITYRQLREGALKIAGGLQNSGLQHGQSVCLMLPTCKEYFFSFFGILLAGGIPVPIYPPVRLSQLEDHLKRQSLILSNCRASTLITVPEARRLAQLLKAQLPDLHTVITPQALSAKSFPPQIPTLVAQDTAFLQYTSGSTGNPKGVILTHANLLANILVDGEAIQAKADDIFVSWLPLYHDMGLIGAWLGSLYFSVPLVIMSPLSFLVRPQRWLWAMHRYRGTLSAAPNFAYELCNTRIEDSSLQGLDLSHWRIALNGAEAVSPVTIERFCQRFAAYGFRSEAMFPVYGLAECSVGVSFPPLHRPPKIDHVQRRALMQTAHATPADASDTHALRFVACGYPLPGHQVRIVDATGRELPERRQGRLEFQGPSATSGYYRNPEATGSLFDGQWLDSGDLAYIANGEIYITGRAKDVIIRAGRNIYPHELEQVIGDIDRIRDGRVAVFGSTDSKSGTENLIVLAETRETDPAELNKLRSHISAIATEMVWLPPDDVVLAPPGTILKTSSGKIRRDACRQIYERGEVGRKQRALWWQLTRIAFSGLLPAVLGIGRYIGARVYTAYTWLLFALLATLAFFMVLILPRETWRWWLMRTSARFLAYFSGIPLKVKGLEYLADEGKTCVYIANHSSYLDAFVVVAALPRRFSFVAKAELTQNPSVHLFLRRIHTEFVDRLDKEQGIMTTHRATRIAREGRSLMFFPEGTFTRMPGLLPFRMGAFIAAVEAGVPIVPIAIQGTRSILHPDSSITHRGDITVTIGKPLNPDEIKRNLITTDLWHIALKLRDEARIHILNHSGEPDLSHEKTTLSEVQINHRSR